MPFYLNFYKHQELKFPDVELKGALTIGRSPENSVVLCHDSVSRHHATLLVEAGDGSACPALRDEGSTNGCIVNDVLISRKTVPIRPGDRIQIGIFRVELVEGESSTPSHPADCGSAEVIFETDPAGQDGLPDPSLRAIHDFCARAPQLEGRLLLETAAQTIAALLPFESIYMVIEKEQGFPTVVAWSSNGPCQPDSIAVSREIVGRCMKEGRALLGSDDGSSTASKGGAYAPAPARSSLCVPLRSQDRTCGVIYVRSQKGVVYRKEQLQILLLLAAHMNLRVAVSSGLEAMEAAKRKLEAILASLPEAVILVDGAYRIVACNTTACKILEDEALVGKDLGQVLAGFDPRFTLDSLRSRSARCLRSFRLERGRQDDPEGKTASRPRTVLAGTWGTNTSQGEAPWKHVLCLHDLSQEKHLERVRLLFVHRLAQRIVTPLTVLTATHSLLEEHLAHIEDPQLAELVGESRGNSELCAMTIRQLLGFTSLSCVERCSSGGWSLHSIEELAEAAVAECGRRIQEKRFRVVPLYKEGCFALEGDREKLLLIFRHLIDNGVKFGKVGGSLVIGADSEADGWVKVSFLDDGPGILSSEGGEDGKILYQVDPSNVDQLPGLGVGLWLVSEAVHYHEGTLKVSSPTNEDRTGTLVQVVLPGVSKELSDQATKAEATMRLSFFSYSEEATR